MKLIHGFITSIVLLIILVFMKLNYLINQELFVFLSILFIVIPTLFILVIQYNRTKKIENIFPEFLRDVAENLETGMTVNKAIRAVSKNDYGVFNFELKKIINESSLYVSFQESLQRLSKRIRSNIINKISVSLSDAQNAGGDLPKVFMTIANDAYIIKDLEQERKSKSKQFVITSYVVFVTFLIIIIIIQKMIAPFAKTNLIGFSNNYSPLDYARLFLELMLINGFFLGIVIGKTGENSYVKGMVHSVILMILSYGVGLLL